MTDRQLVCPVSRYWMKMISVWLFSYRRGISIWGCSRMMKSEVFRRIDQRMNGEPAPCVVRKENNE